MHHIAGGEGGDEAPLRVDAEKPLPYYHRVPLFVSSLRDSLAFFPPLSSTQLPGPCAVAALPLVRTQAESRPLLC